MCQEEMKCLKAAFRHYLFENKSCANHVISTYILLTQIIERCPVLIQGLCLVPKITVYSECGEWSVTLKQQTLHLRQISKSQLSHLLMFLTTRQLYFKWNISSAWGCAITFRSASSGKKDVILRPIVPTGRWSLQTFQTWNYSGSASSGGTPFCRPVARRGAKTTELGWQGMLHQPDSFLYKRPASLCHLLAKRCNWGAQRCWICSSARSKKHINMFPRVSGSCLNETLQTLWSRGKGHLRWTAFLSAELNLGTLLGAVSKVSLWSMKPMHSVNPRQQFRFSHRRRHLGIISAAHRQISKVAWRTESSHRPCVISDSLMQMPWAPPCIPTGTRSLSSGCYAESPTAGLCWL